METWGHSQAGLGPGRSRLPVWGAARYRRAEACAVEEPRLLCKERVSGSEQNWEPRDHVSTPVHAAGKARERLAVISTDPSPGGPTAQEVGRNKNSGGFSWALWAAPRTGRVPVINPGAGQAPLQRTQRPLGADAPRRLSRRVRRPASEALGCPKSPRTSYLWIFFGWEQPSWGATGHRGSCHSVCRWGSPALPHHELWKRGLYGPPGAHPSALVWALPTLHRSHDDAHD